MEVYTDIQKMALSCNDKRSFKIFLDPDGDTDPRTPHPQKLIRSTFPENFYQNPSTNIQFLLQTDAAKTELTGIGL